MFGAVTTSGEIAVSDLQQRMHWFACALDSSAKIDAKLISVFSIKRIIQAFNDICWTSISPKIFLSSNQPLQYHPSQGLWEVNGL